MTHPHQSLRSQNRAEDNFKVSKFSKAWNHRMKMQILVA